MLNNYADKPYSNLTPQCQQILDHFVLKPSISAMEAHNVYKLRSLSRRIADLREVGYEFDKKWDRDPTNQRYLKYFLVGWRNPATQELEVLL